MRMQHPNYPWRPRKVNPESEPYHEIVMKLSQDQFDMLQGYANGMSMDDLARGFMCDKSTIAREFKRIIRGSIKMDIDKPI